MFRLERCKTRAAYSAKPLQPLQLDLERVLVRFKPIAASSVALVLEVEGLNIAVHRDGEIIFQRGSDLKQMKKIAEEIYAFRK